MLNSVEEDGTWRSHDDLGDSEWDDFAELLADFRHRRAASAQKSQPEGETTRVMLQPPRLRGPPKDYLVYPSVYSGQDDDENDDEDDLDYVQTMVCVREEMRKIIGVKLFYY